MTDRPETPFEPAGTPERTRQSGSSGLMADQGFRRLASLVAVIGVLIALEGSDVSLSCRPDYPADIHLPNDPVQTDTDAEPWDWNGYHFEAKAAYDIEAEVVRTRRYVRGRGRHLVPYDVGVVWGPMTNEELLEGTRWSQGSRFLSWRTDDPRIQEFGRYIANMHLVASTPAIRRQIARLDPGDVIHMTGYLVRITADDGFVWNTSLSREDEGNGACELMWVSTIEVR